MNTVFTIQIVIKANEFWPSSYSNSLYNLKEQALLLGIPTAVHNYFHLQATITTKNTADLQHLNLIAQNFLLHHTFQGLSATAAAAIGIREGNLSRWSSKKVTLPLSRLTQAFNIHFRTFKLLKNRPKPWRPWWETGALLSCAALGKSLSLSFLIYKMG